jgi:hypothetical protein
MTHTTPCRTSCCPEAVDDYETQHPVAYAEVQKQLKTMARNALLWRFINSLLVAAQKQLMITKHNTL